MLLNFGDRMRTGVFNMVWPLTASYSTQMKRQFASGKSFCPQKYVIKGRKLIKAINQSWWLPMQEFHSHQNVSEKWKDENFQLWTPTVSRDEDIHHVNWNLRLLILICFISAIMPKLAPSLISFNYFWCMVHK